MKQGSLELKSLAQLARDPEMRREARLIERLGRRKRADAISIITALSQSALWSEAAKKKWRRERRRPIPDVPNKYSL